MSTDGHRTKCRRNIAEKYNRLSRAHERYRRQTTDRQTDGRRSLKKLRLLNVTYSVTTTKTVGLTLNRLGKWKLRKHAQFRGDRSNRCWDKAIFRFAQYGGCPPSWVCCARVWTTREEHLVVFVIVQNLVGISAVVLIICMFLDFASLAWKCLLTLWGFDPLNGEAY